MSILRVRDFRLLWIGECVSLLGDQFYLIALPWLVLRLTGSALAIGTVLAVAAIPRAVFMLVGGALTDRFSPRLVMLVSNVVRGILVAVLASLTVTGAVAPWMLYIFAILFGLADAFYFPAQSSILPTVVPADLLQMGNMLMQGTAQVAVFLGPVAAGGLIVALGAAHGSQTGLVGVGLALGVDAGSFAVSALTLALIRGTRVSGTAEATSSPERLLRSVAAGLAYAWHDSTLRTFLLLVAAINVLVNGPMAVGIPILVEHGLPGGAATFGLIVSAFGGGSLAGTVLAGVLPRPAPHWMGSWLLVVSGLVGIGVALLGFATSAVLAVAIAAGMGAANGYVVILFITWLQVRTPPEMLGRTMSLLMVAALGLNPISNAVAGFVGGLSARGLFVIAGSLMTVVVLVSALNPAARSLEVPSDEAMHTPAI